MNNVRDKKIDAYSELGYRRPDQRWATEVIRDRYKTSPVESPLKEWWKKEQLKNLEGQIDNG